MKRTTWFDMSDAIAQYLKAQHAKGLIDDVTHPRLSGNINLVANYKTHRGTQQHIIQPEVRRLVAEYDYHINVSIRETVVGEYVEVTLHLWWEEG